MNVSPVSFGSLMVFTLKSGKPKADVPTLMRSAFDNNQELKIYKLQSPIHHDEKIDGSVHNASLSFAESLNAKYKNQLPKGSNKVMFTVADFYVNPRETEERYFLTAATEQDEEKIHSILSKSPLYYTVKFRQNY